MPEDNMLDTYSLFFALFGLVLLSIAHTVVFRFIDRRAVFLWLGLVIFSVTLLVLLGWGTLLMGSDQNLKEHGGALGTAIMLSIMLYWMLVPFYLYGFGIIESSIRIRILSEIASAGESGISEKALFEKYNKDSIIRKRLERFLASGELKFDGRYYRIKNRFSFYWVLAGYFRLFWKLYY